MQDLYETLAAPVPEDVEATSLGRTAETKAHETRDNDFVASLLGIEFP